MSDSNPQNNLADRNQARINLELFSAVVTMKKEDPARPTAIHDYASATGQTVEAATQYVDRYRNRCFGV